MEMDDLQNHETWEEITEQLKSRIQALYPAWTDFNVHDPGMALVELLAWMKDIQLFHMEQISREHKRKYGKLLGIKCLMPAPSETFVTVSADRQVLLPPKTKFFAGDICFESLREQAVAENVFSGFVMRRKEKSVTIRGDWLKKGKSICVYPFGRQPEAGDICEIELLYPLKPGWPYSLSAEVADFSPEHAVVEEAYDGHGFYPLGEILIEYRTKDGWDKACVRRDSTYAFAQDGSVDFFLEEEMSGEVPGLRITLLRGDYLVPPCITRVSLAQVKVLQQETLAGELTFAGNAFPGQRFDIRGRNLLADLLIVSLAGNRWERVEDFDCSTPECCHYRLEDGILVFGDGIRGRAPKGILTVENRVETLGDRGNIKAYAINRTDFLREGQTVKVENERESSGGRDGEDEEAMFLRYTRERTDGQRAITLEDYEYLVRRMPGLAIADCRAYEKNPGKNQVILAVKPKTPDGRGVPNEAYIRNIYNYLEEKRQLGTRILVVPPEYIPIRVTCEITAEVKFRDAGKLVEKRIEEWLSGRAFGEGIIYGELYGMIDTLPWVKAVHSLWIEAGNKGRRNTRGDLRLPEHGLLKLLKATCLLLTDKDGN